MTLPRKLRTLLVGLAALVLAACGGAAGGTSGGAVIADLEPLPLDDDDHSGMP